MSTNIQENQIKRLNERIQELLNRKAQLDNETVANPNDSRRLRMQKNSINREINNVKGQIQNLKRVVNRIGRNNAEPFARMYNTNNIMSDADAERELENMTTNPLQTNASVSTDDDSTVNPLQTNIPVNLASNDNSETAENMSANLDAENVSANDNSETAENISPNLDANISTPNIASNTFSPLHGFLPPDKNSTYSPFHRMPATESPKPAMQQEFNHPLENSLPTEPNNNSNYNPMQTNNVSTNTSDNYNPIHRIMAPEPMPTVTPDTTVNLQSNLPPSVPKQTYNPMHNATAPSSFQNNAYNPMHKRVAPKYTVKQRQPAQRRTNNRQSIPADNSVFNPMNSNGIEMKQFKRSTKRPLNVGFRETLKKRTKSNAQTKRVNSNICTNIFDNGSKTTRKYFYPSEFPKLTKIKPITLTRGGKKINRKRKTRKFVS